MVHSKGKDEQEEAVLSWLLEAFPSFSLEAIAAAYTDAQRNPDLAVHILSSSSSSSLITTTANAIVKPPPQSSENALSNTFRFRSSIPGPSHGRHLAEFFPSSGKLSYSDLCTRTNSFAESLKSQSSYDKTHNLNKLQDNLSFYDTLPMDLSLGMADKAACKKPSATRTNSFAESLKSQCFYDKTNNLIKLQDNPSIYDTMPIDLSLGMADKAACKKPLAMRENAEYQEKLSFLDRTTCNSSLAVNGEAVDKSSLAMDNDSILGVKSDDFPTLSKKVSVPRSCTQIAKRPPVSRPSKKSSAASGTFSNAQLRKKISSNVMRADESIGFCASKQDIKAPTMHMTRKGECNEDDKDALQQQISGEDFLFSMLGDGFQLGIEVVRDVLGHFNGDVEKSLDTLLQMAATNSSSHYDKKSEVESSTPTQKFFDGYQQSVVDQLHKEFPYIEHGTLFEFFHAMGSDYGLVRNVLLEAGVDQLSTNSVHKDHLDLSKLVLDSLFKAETNNSEAPTCSRACKKPPRQHLVTVEKVSVNPEMNMDVVSPEIDSYSVVDDCNDYDLHRSTARQHWETMKCYFKEAAAAYTRGEHARAVLLSKKGKMFKDLANEASKRASGYIFHPLNEDRENNVTVDLHGEHVQEALQLLKLHLKSFTPIPSVCTLTVITGSGMHNNKLKETVIRYLDKKGLQWTETKPGCLAIKIKRMQNLDDAKTATVLETNV